MFLSAGAISLWSNKLVPAESVGTPFWSNKAGLKNCESGKICGGPIERKYKYLVGIFFATDRSLGVGTFSWENLSDYTRQLFYRVEGRGFNLAVGMSNRDF
jgi:hypothetical protein